MYLFSKHGIQQMQSLLFSKQAQAKQPVLEAEVPL